MNPLQPRVSHQFDAFAPHPELDDIDTGDIDWTDPATFLNMVTPPRHGVTGNNATSGGAPGGQERDSSAVC